MHRLWKRAKLQVKRRTGKKRKPPGDPKADLLYPTFPGQVWTARRSISNQITAPNGTHLRASFSNNVLTRFQLVSSANVTQAQTDLQYDSRGRLYRAFDLAGTLVQYRYDRSSNLRKVIDGRGNTTTFIYGNANELKTLAGRGVAELVLRRGRTGQQLLRRAGLGLPLPALRA